ncbi:MAG: hypothetical protein U1E05_11165 [Patescibacteria group bacterium]|nr:hypothetical protein [Patescibacteria group bacterium]
MLRTTRLPKTAAKQRGTSKPLTLPPRDSVLAATAGDSNRHRGEPHQAAACTETLQDKRRCLAVPRRDQAGPVRCKGIPFRVFVDAFATVDEELAPEPDWADFPNLD